MKKSSIAVVAAIVGVALSLKADIIYWMADPEPDIEFTTAKLVAVDGNNQVVSDGYEWAGHESVVSYAETGFTASDITSLSFFVELLNGNTVVGRTSDYNYSAVSSYIYSGGMAPPPAGLWTVTDFTPVPEPTSGMLLVLGGALLALRRRKLA